ncbi:beta-lactamase domain protein [Fibrella aestuarina BUZ 2]|uniref:Beta-lactamase domain protein n=1 Tax=Fibrella aestuarina BUZ 2 TaxID=1166018 RepID=I0KCD9_9BACT|nr:MBL fold metallo-hydrolase [Fibrella aestuarina]CCH01792.1 beta-lactamase domain protein [Fibrella aestuarina BUZ 2]
MASLRQLTASLYQISLGVVNVFVIDDRADGLTLIDTGYKDSSKAIVSALRQAGKDPASLKRIILTHSHPDHAGSAAALGAEWGIPVWAYHLDVPLLANGTAGEAPIHRSPGVINWLVYHLFIKRGSPAIDPVTVDRPLTDKEVLPIAGGLQVLHTPGHSSGHISLWLQQEGVLIAGDLCANVAGLDFSTVYEDRALGLSSILAVSQLPFDKAVFGHGKLLAPRANEKLASKFGAL